MVVVGTWNLFHPGTDFGPSDEPAYQAKLTALAGLRKRRACIDPPGQIRSVAAPPASPVRRPSNCRFEQEDEQA